MIDETLRKIEARLQVAEAIKPERREELLDLLRQLKEEVGALPQTHRSQVESIAGLAESCATEATRDLPDEEQLTLSVKSLNASVQGFEASHPRLVQVVNSISHTLSNLGI